MQSDARQELTSNKNTMGQLKSLWAAIVAGRFLGEADGNPFRLTRRQAVGAVLAASVAGSLVYFGLVWWASNELARAIVKADVLSQLLKDSSIYVPPESSPPETPPRVNDLAIAVWLRGLSIAPEDAGISEIFQDERLTLLINALRYGNTCNEEKQPPVRTLLNLPTVQRIPQVAAYLAPSCGDNDGLAPTETVAGSIVRNLAEFKTEDCSYSDLGQIVAPRCVAWFSAGRDASGRALVKDVFTESSVYTGSGGSNAQRIFGNLVQAGRPDQAVSGNEEFDDGQIRAVEDFEVALLAAIDGDPGVVAARRILSIVRGSEQLAILTLFLVIAALLLLRWSNYRWHESSRKATIDDLRLRLTAKKTERDSTKKILGRADAIRDILDAANGKGPTSVSPVVRRLLEACKSDLQMLHKHELTDEHTQKRANDLLTQLDMSRAMVEWGIVTLPALGFLGTVHGILNALQGVGGLGQGDAATRMATLVSVSGSLGLAFATTLLALLFMIPLSYFDTRLRRAERGTVLDMEEFLDQEILS